jgi:hypothetical protein
MVPPLERQMMEPLLLPLEQAGQGEQEQEQEEEQELPVAMMRLLLPLRDRIEVPLVVPMLELVLLAIGASIQASAAPNLGVASPIPGDRGVPSLSEPPGHSIDRHSHDHTLPQLPTQGPIKLKNSSSLLI